MSSSSGLSPNDPWQLAKARFLADLDPEEQKLFQHATLENLFYTTSNANLDDAESSRVRSASSKLGPLLAAIDNYGKALDIFSSTASLYIAPIWGSIRVVLVLAKTHGKFFDRILETLERIGDILPRFRDYERIYDKTKHQRLTHALSNAYLEIIVFCTQVRRSLCQQKSSSFRRLLKPLSLDREFGEAVTRFRQHKQNVEEEARTCHMIEAAEERNTQLVLRAVERKAKLLARLSKVDCMPRHRKLAESRHEGTGLWLTACDAYQKWDSAQSSAVLCCYGIPGSGKSVIASSLIDQLATDRRTVFYYCDYADKRTLEPTNVFGTLARQLLAVIDPVPEALAVEIERADHDGDRMLDYKKTLGFFKTILELSKVLLSIVFDGLDETSDRSQELIFAGLKETLEHSAAVVKLIVTGREEIGTSLRVTSGVPFYTVPVSAEAIALDIGAYVKASTRRRIANGSLLIRDPKLEEVIIQALIEGAKGMFLWVEFQLQDLSEQESDHGIRAVLQNLPRSLSETYDRLLAKIEGKERQRYIERMFRWLVAARQPLHTEELLEGIAFTLEDTSWEQEKIPTDFKRFVRACGNLIVVDHDTQIVQLAHYTVQQYIVQGATSSFHFSKKEAHISLGEVCVAYLNFINFDTHITKFKENTCADLITLSRVAEKGSLISPDNPGSNLLGAWNHFRQRTTPRPVDMTRFTPIRAAQPINLKAFALLDYIRSHWLWHCLAFEPKEELDIHDNRMSRREALFQSLIISKRHVFEFRPWQYFDLSDEEDNVNLMHLLGWALSNDHSYLIRVVFKGKLSKRLRIILHTASDWFFVPKNIIHGYRTTTTRMLTSASSTKDFTGAKMMTGITSTDIRDEALQMLETFSEESHIVQLNPQGWLYSRLIYACREGHLFALEACLQRSSSKNVGENVKVEDITLLRQVAIEHMFLEAASFGHLAVVDHIYRVAKPTGHLWVATGSGRMNVLDQAVLGGHLLTVVFLLNKGYQISGLYQDLDSFLATINLAIEIDNRRLLEVLLFLKQNHSNDSHPDFTIDIPLSSQADMIVLAGRLGRSALVGMLVSNGITIEPCENKGVSMLVLAACIKDLSSSELLRFNVDALNTVIFQHLNCDPYAIYLSPTPLYVACCKGDLKMVQFLVSAGADTQLVSPVKFTTMKVVDDILIRVHSQGPKELSDIEWPIDNSLLEVISEYAFSSWQHPIMAAIVLGHTDITNFLLRAGAPPPCMKVISSNLPTTTNQTIEGWPSVQAYLARLSSAVGIDVQVEVEVSSQHSNIVEGNAKEVEQLTKLGNQLKMHNASTMRILILAGADVDVLRPEHVHCLLFAMSLADSSLCELILCSTKYPSLLLEKAMTEASEKSMYRLAMFLTGLERIYLRSFGGTGNQAIEEINNFICTNRQLRQMLLDDIYPGLLSTALKELSFDMTFVLGSRLLTLLLSELLLSDSLQRRRSVQWCSELLKGFPLDFQYQQELVLAEAFRQSPSPILQENLLLVAILTENHNYVKKSFDPPRLANGDTSLIYAIRAGSSSSMYKALVRPSTAFIGNDANMKAMDVAQHYLDFSAVMVLYKKVYQIDYLKGRHYTVVCRCIALGDTWQFLAESNPSEAMIFGEHTYSIARGHYLQTLPCMAIPGVFELEDNSLPQIAHSSNPNPTIPSKPTSKTPTRFLNRYPSFSLPPRRLSD